MEINAYNRAAAEHMFKLFSMTELRQWYVQVDLSRIEHPELRQMGVPILNVHPMAVRDVQFGDACLTFNMSLSGRRTHVVVPYIAIIGGTYEIDKLTAFVPALMYVPYEENEAESDDYIKTDSDVVDKSTTKIVMREGNVTKVAFGKQPTNLR